MSRSKSVVILDKDMKPFFVHPNVKGVFNLPKGTYYTENELKRCRPRKYYVRTLPKRERKNKIKPFKFVIQESNPNKCQIDRHRGIIYVDINFWNNLTIPEKHFVLSHEKGHYMYATETYCDLYALKEMIKAGFNPSQVAKSILYTLSDKNVARRKKMIYKYCK